MLDLQCINQEKKHNLTVLVSMRNTSDLDTIYVLNAKYYDTHGKTVRAYFDHPIYLAPMETIEIIIDLIAINTKVFKVCRIINIYHTLQNILCNSVWFGSC